MTISASGPRASQLTVFGVPVMDAGNVVRHEADHGLQHLHQLRSRDPAGVRVFDSGLREVWKSDDGVTVKDAASEGDGRGSWRRSPTTTALKRKYLRNPLPAWTRPC